MDELLPFNRVQRKSVGYFIDALFLCVTELPVIFILNVHYRRGRWLKGGFHCVVLGFTSAGSQWRRAAVILDFIRRLSAVELPDIGLVLVDCQKHHCFSFCWSLFYV